MGRRKFGDPVDGWIILDKPLGETSTRALGRVRSALRARKGGHAGTLDPLATGLLPIALGEATKLVERVMGGDKTYTFTVRWGVETTTDDSEGEVVESRSERPEGAEIEAALGAFVGQIEQVPPAFSAIKVAGERAYDLARDGAPPDLPARTVRVWSLELVDRPDRDQARFRLRCGKGAYVRALARDLGRTLGCLGHVTTLRRTAVGGFSEEDAISLDKLEAMGHIDAREKALLPISTALDDIPALAVTGGEATRLKNGQTIRVPHDLEGTVLVTSRQQPVALADIQSGEVRPLRVFNLQHQGD